jgi:hypothetical protein
LAAQQQRSRVTKAKCSSWIEGFIEVGLKIFIMQKSIELKHFQKWQNASTQIGYY